MYFESYLSNLNKECLYFKSILFQLYIYQVMIIIIIIHQLFLLIYPIYHCFILIIERYLLIMKVLKQVYPLLQFILLNFFFNCFYYMYF
jgi:hypothetical protein